MEKPFLSSWPWANLGNFKYVLYGPLIAETVRLRHWGKNYQAKEDWCLHILLISTLRCFIHQLWFSYSSIHFLAEKHRIMKQGVDFQQIDREWDWDNFIILQAVMAALFCRISWFSESFPLWNLNGFLCAMAIHAAVAEPLYYFFHRAFHSYKCLYNHYHSLHHSSVETQSFTAGNASLLEHMVLSMVMGIPLLGSMWLGGTSTGLIYLYILGFDFLRSLGHCNVEVIPAKLFDCFPFIRYLIYSPTYHSLHHQEQDTNFCLSMPLYDALFHTLNPKSWDLQRKNSKGEEARVADFVFLAHNVDVYASLHHAFLMRSFSSLPCEMRLCLVPPWSIAFLFMLGLSSFRGNTMIISSYHLRKKMQQTWGVTRYGFQYFLPFCKDEINNTIEEAILSADKAGVKVLSLAALNKSEALNGGGKIFVDKNPNLRVRVVHGNTLTAAVILREINEKVDDVFLTGATSKLGRAIAIYLCIRKVRVLMLTNSKKRFESILHEAPVEYRKFLVHVTRYDEGKNCKTWIVGKWMSARDQRWAPPGTYFHQFAIPVITESRRDCKYGKMAAIRLPEDVQGLGSCEYVMGRGVVHACHAGGMVHLLEGWKHHEVGAIDVDMIDVVWNKALKHGFKPVTD
ncbi:protein ECERIFERUM 3 [Amborella trichopoda]|nr:protein ECERIFERUM 3 [Amborella trichopoda]|eukprot:XP_006836672.2 protein ECERIFERUM 3 [Amborella trichopoda]